MYRTLKILANIIGKPNAAFRVLTDQADWVKAFIIIALVSIGIAWAVLPFSQQVGHAKMLESSLDAPQTEQNQTTAERLGFLPVLVTPFSLFIKCLVSAGILYFGCQFLGSQQALKFKSMFAVTVHTELILVLSHLINAVFLLCFKDMSDVQKPIDLQMIPGLHLLFGDHPLGVLQLTLLSQVTPFAIWYLIVLSLGVAIVADLKRKRVEWLIVLVWLVDIGFRVAVSAFF